MKCGRKLIDLNNKTFERLTVIGMSTNRWNKKVWICKCICGNIINVLGSKLISGHTKSCGCLKREKLKNGITTTHGFTKTRFYTIYKHMISRCYKKYSTSYKRYGAKGIRVCEGWKVSFDKFKEDMYEDYLRHVQEYGENQTTLDRINSNGDYCKNNCRWATYLVQNQNKSNNKNFIAIAPSGEIFKERVIARFARDNNLSQDCIEKCLKGLQLKHKGWTFKYEEIN